MIALKLPGNKFKMMHNKLLFTTKRDTDPSLNQLRKQLSVLRLLRGRNLTIFKAAYSVSFFDKFSNDPR